MMTKDSTSYNYLRWEHVFEVCYRPPRWWRRYWKADARRVILRKGDEEIEHARSVRLVARASTRGDVQMAMRAKMDDYALAYRELNFAPTCETFRVWA